MTNTHKRGEDNECSKLTDEKVRAARNRVLIHKTFTIADEADWNEVSPSTMANAIHGRTWRHIPMPAGHVHAEPRRNGHWYKTAKLASDKAAAVATAKTEAELETAKSPGKAERQGKFTTEIPEQTRGKEYQERAAAFRPIPEDDAEEPQRKLGPQEVSMDFHCVDNISTSVHTVVEATDVIIELDNGYIFSRLDGRCHNDDTSFNCHRTLQLASIGPQV